MNDTSTAELWGHQLAADDPALTGLPIPLATASHRWQLQRDENGHLQLLDAQSRKQRPLRIELGSLDMQRRTSAGRQQPLAKACGLHKGGEPRIHDLTGGLCRDAWCLASLGSDVVVWERHPILFALIRDALRLANTPVAQRVTSVYADGRAGCDKAADILFLDPMFPQAGKRAAPALEMQILQELVGSDTDGETLLQMALSSGARRVVLKRPPRGAKVTLGKPDFSFGGGRAVYDVYLPR
ncbi:MAG: class I SAM-dependent methyltransferase [Oceanococcus sp.]